MSKVREKIKLTSYDELLKVEITDGLKEIDVDKLHDFSNHPFKVSDDEKMEELTESIRERGVLLPILVRKTNDEEYEIISGHRRTHAARLAGIEKVPVIIRELSDDDATIVMVDSNIQREEILPSEKAYAFQMKLEAIQHKGIKGEESREVVGEANGLSGRQVSRYIKLTNLLPELLEMVDEKKIAIKLAVEIAELSESDIDSIQQVMDSGRFQTQQRMAWENFGIAFGAILVNEMEGMEWVTVIEGQKEYPALQFMCSDMVLDPAALVWGKAKKGLPCDLKSEFRKIKREAEAVLDDLNK